MENKHDKAVEAIRKIKDRFSDAIVSSRVKETIDFYTFKQRYDIAFELNPQYDYDPEYFDKWKEVVDADSWYFNINKGKLIMNLRLK